MSEWNGYKRYFLLFILFPAISLTSITTFLILSIFSLQHQIRKRIKLFRTIDVLSWTFDSFKRSIDFFDLKIKTNFSVSINKRKSWLIFICLRFLTFFWLLFFIFSYNFKLRIFWNHIHKLSNALFVLYS